MKSFENMEKITQNIERYCRQNVITHSAEKSLGCTYLSVLDNLVKKIPPGQS